MAPTSRDIVVIGSSAGGVAAVSNVLGALPSTFPAAVFVTMHLSPTSESALAAVLGRRTPLPCAPARDGDRIEPGRVFVSPPDHHLLVETDRVALTRGPREHSFRPAIDALFRSAAVSHGPRVVGVVLTGARHDGAAGLAAIKARGGLAVVQSPDDAEFPAMPTAAITQVPTVDFVVPIAEMAAL